MESVLQPSLQHSKEEEPPFPQSLVPALWASLYLIFLPISGRQSCSSSLTVQARQSWAQWPCQPSCGQGLEGQKTSKWARCHSLSCKSPVARCTEGTCLPW